MTYISALLEKDSVRNNEKHSFGQTADNRVLCLSKIKEEGQPSNKMTGSIQFIFGTTAPSGPEAPHLRGF
jgi:hypothetical protein